ncbi:MAG: 5'/3'-nucleotidase SurE [Leptolyngbyaceae cyanobacterium CRU_2_3]|nr:5'/3'-nucleotidase SurE [Leptolyngbyaceae cyanobacterium CRU_2_3]
MTTILTNDDGIAAPGLRSLLQAVQAQGIVNLAIVAPKSPHSGCGHQVTTHRPIHVAAHSKAEFAIDGTPADCTRIAISHLFHDTQLVLAGINAGGNLGADVYTSGTVAAVREAALHRIPGIAISHYIHYQRAIDWNLAARLAVRVLDKLLADAVEPGTYWNVNLPHLDADSPEPEIIICPLCTQPLPTAYRVETDNFYYAGDYSKRVHDPGSDVEICFSGHIAVTPIQL